MREEEEGEREDREERERERERIERRRRGREGEREEEGERERIERRGRGRGRERVKILTHSFYSCYSGCSHLTLDAPDRLRSTVYTSKELGDTANFSATPFIRDMTSHRGHSSIYGSQK